jgi:hypothetical protein
MERRAASHTEEEELNQRRRLLNLARKGDPKAISRLFELYQVKVFTGEAFIKARGRAALPVIHEKPKSGAAKRAAARANRASRRLSARKGARSRKRAHR